MTPASTGAFALNYARHPGTRTHDRKDWRSGQSGTNHCPQGFAWYELSRRSQLRSARFIAKICGQGTHIAGNAARKMPLPRFAEERGLVSILRVPTRLKIKERREIHVAGSRVRRKGNEVIEGVQSQSALSFFAPKSGAGPGRFAVSTCAEDPQGCPFHPHHKSVGPSFREPSPPRSRLPRPGSWVEKMRPRRRQAISPRHSSDRPVTHCSQPRTLLCNFPRGRIVRASVALPCAPYPRHLGAPRPRCGAGGKSEKVKKKRITSVFRQCHSISGFPTKLGVGSQSWLSDAPRQPCIRFAAHRG